jgi:GT2 family glycosyltransferase
MTMAVAVVSYNTRELLRACLASVWRDAPAAVLVADNGSADGSVGMVRSEFPGTIVIVDESNRGYGAAANQAIRRAATPYVLLLNSDTEIAPGTLAGLAAYLDAHPQAAIVGPRLLERDGSLQESTFPWPSPVNALLGESKLSALVRLVPGVRSRHLRTWAHDRPRIVPWVLGAALAIRRSAFDEVGGFDERFVMYFEETDLSRRLAAAGWETHFAPVGTVMHIGGASTEQVRPAMAVRFYESMARWYRHHEPSQLRPAAVVTATFRSAVWAREAVRAALASGPGRERAARARDAWRTVVRERLAEVRGRG